MNLNNEWRSLSNPDLRPVFAWDFFGGWNAGK